MKEWNASEQSRYLTRHGELLTLIRASTRGEATLMKHRRTREAMHSFSKLLFYLALCISGDGYASASDGESLHT